MPSGSSRRAARGYPRRARFVAAQRARPRRARTPRRGRCAALASVGLDRRRGLWALKALGEAPLPLFAARTRTPSPSRSAGSTRAITPTLPLPQGAERVHQGAGEDSEARAAALLPEMPLGEHVVEDYATTGLTLKRHPLAFLRAELAREGLVAAADLATLPVDRRLAIAGLVLIRQRPGSANGVVFITIEDETGIANLIVWPAILERFRRAALGATLLYCRGRLQREESVIHVVAEDLRDLTARLNTLRERTGDERRRRRETAVRAARRLPGYDSRDIVIPSRDFR